MRRIKFQFHVGAIIREWDPLRSSAMPKFQFHVGAIISHHFIIMIAPPFRVSIPRWCNYKVTWDIARLVLKPMFQFHVGAIIRKGMILGALSAKGFQFHVGAIISNIIGFFSLAGMIVSIPRWCNYKLGSTSRRNIQRLFQFHVGAIIRIHCEPVDFVRLAFQFHVGAIISRRNKNRNMEYTCFNSTLVQL